jgi:hypothetical protein
MNFIRYARLQWDRVTAVAMVIAGGLVIILGWIGVSQAALTAQQLPYIISGGIGGLFLLGVGGVLWLSADLRDEWRKLDAIERQQHTSTPDEAGLAIDDPFATVPAPGQLFAEDDTPSSNGKPKRVARPLRATASES